MAALDFPNGPSLGQIFTAPGGSPTYVWNGTAWVAAGQVAGPTTEQFFPLDGLASLDIAVPTWAKGVDLNGCCFMGLTTNSVQMQVSVDGSTFLAGTNYTVYGPLGNTGSSAYQPYAASGASENAFRLSVGGDQGTPHQFDAQLNLIRATTSNHFAYKAYGRSLDGASTSLGRAFWGSGHIPAAATTALAIKALRLLASSGTFGAGSWIRVKWLGDSAQVPIAGAIAEAPQDGTDYVRNNGVWRPAAVGKISSGVVASAVANLDIPMPAGYHTLELLVSNYVHVTDLQAVCLRFSYDNGATFLASGQYTHAYNVSTQLAANNPAGGTGANHVIVTPNTASAAAARITFKLTMPVPMDATVAQQVFTESMGSTGSAYYRSTGMGIVNGFLGAAQALRILPGTGNIAAGARWQLNGIR